MNKASLQKMTKGWFVGDFEPSVLKTRSVEVAVKRYVKGDHEQAHYHKVATEITVIVSGLVRMNGKEYREDDIIVIEPNEPTDFQVLEDTVTAVVKIPGEPDDKYIV